MELTIEKNSKIGDIQNAFNAYYPYLKIEFFKPLEPTTKKTVKPEKILANETIGKVSHIHTVITIKTSGSITVAQLEKDFLDKLDLNIKLYRKCGTLWIETTLTENWTLFKQNIEGELLTKPSAPDKEGNNTSVDDEQWMEVE
ncbi:MAG: hypothetical protein JST58_14485 [Bacteroidetes bacterium]|nr:hypothetical protein [Bacteroidota bacterium]